MSIGGGAKSSRSKGFGGFTLAEVLITLGIIGVVAAMTLPTLINNYKKQQTIAQLKKAYSEISQVFQRAEADHETMDTWDFSAYEEGYPRTSYFAENYFLPYIKTIKICNPSSTDCFTINVADTHIAAITASGYSFNLWVDRTSIGGWIYVDVNGPNQRPNELNKDIFAMKFIFRNDSIDTGHASTKKGITFEGLQYTNPMTRAELIENNYCAALIMLDGWQISRDNPCWK